MFLDRLAERTVRKPTARQLYLAGLIYKPVAVDRFGRVQVHGWTYGGASTQEALLPWHGTDMFDGGLRNVEAAMHQAALFAGKERSTVEHLAWAIRDLKLAPKGADA